MFFKHMLFVAVFLLFSIVSNLILKFISTIFVCFKSLFGHDIMYVGSNLYFWIAIIPTTVRTIFLIYVSLFFSLRKSSVISFLVCTLVNLHNFLLQQLVLFVGAKLQHVIATLVLENAGITEYASGVKLRPRDELFWFKKPELLLSLIHFIQFQVCKILGTLYYSHK